MQVKIILSFMRRCSLCNIGSKVVLTILFLHYRRLVIVRSWKCYRNQFRSIRIHFRIRRQCGKQKTFPTVWSYFLVRSIITFKSAALCNPANSTQSEDMCRDRGSFTKTTPAYLDHFKHPFNKWEQMQHPSNTKFSTDKCPNIYDSRS